MPLLPTPSPMLPIQRIDSLATSSWFGVLVLFVLVALAFSVSAHRKQYTLYVRNLLNKQGRVMNYDTESSSVWASVFLCFAVVSSFVLLVVSTGNNYIYFDNLLAILLLYGVFILYFLLKWILIPFMGFVFNLREVSLAFRTDYFVIIALAGLAFLPISLGQVYIVEYLDSLWQILIVFVAVLTFITLFIKLLQIFYSGIGSLFYIFLYLCTSEILPLFVAMKVASIVVINV